MTSYQKLKAENKRLRDRINDLLDKPEMYLTESLGRRIQKDVNKALMFGEHKATGKLNQPFFS